MWAPTGGPAASASHPLPRRRATRRLEALDHTKRRGRRTRGCRQPPLEAATRLRSHLVYRVQVLDARAASGREGGVRQREAEGRSDLIHVRGAVRGGQQTHGRLLQRNDGEAPQQLVDAARGASAGARGRIGAGRGSPHPTRGAEQTGSGEAAGERARVLKLAQLAVGDLAELSLLSSVQRRPAVAELLREIGAVRVRRDLALGMRRRASRAAETRTLAHGGEAAVKRKYSTIPRSRSFARWNMVSNSADRPAPSFSYVSSRRPSNRTFFSMACTTLGPEADAMARERAGGEVECNLGGALR